VCASATQKVRGINTTYRIWHRVLWTREQIGDEVSHHRAVVTPHARMVIVTCFDERRRKPACSVDVLPVELVRQRGLRQQWHLIRISAEGGDHIGRRRRRSHGSRRWRWRRWWCSRGRRWPEAALPSSNAWLLLGEHLPAWDPFPPQKMPDLVATHALPRLEVVREGARTLCAVVPTSLNESTRNSTESRRKSHAPSMALRCIAEGWSPLAKGSGDGHVGPR
jgi:hypothetical protein